MPSTRSIRKNGLPSTSPVVSSQRTRGTATSVSSPTRRITSMLVVQAVVREHRHVGFGGRDPGHPVLFDRAACVQPAPGQQDRLRRHAVGVDAAFHGDLGRDITQNRGQPLGQGRRHVRHVPAGPLEPSDILDGWFIRHELVLPAHSYATVGSDMKAEPWSVDKAPGAGRPRDPRIDAAILRATADLLVEIGYSNVTMAAVAERAGTTKTALYRRWSSKAELVHEAAFPTHTVSDRDSAGRHRR